MSSRFPIKGGPEAHERELLDRAPAGGEATIVAPAQETAQHRSDDRRDEPGAALVVGEEALGLVGREDAMGRREVLPTGQHLVCQPSLDVVEPPGPATPTRGHDRLPRDRVESNDLEDGLPTQPRLSARVHKEEEPVAEEEAQVGVIEVDGESQE